MTTEDETAASRQGGRTQPVGRVRAFLAGALAMAAWLGVAEGAQLEVMADTTSGLVAIDDLVSINDSGAVAFTATDATASKVFVAPSPGGATAVSFGSAGRVFLGASVNNESPPRVASRDRFSGPVFFMRTWVNGSFSLIGRSPANFDSAAGFVDLNEAGLTAFSGLTSGSSFTSLFVGDASTLRELARYPGNVPVRPQISDGNRVVIRDNLNRIMVWPYPSGAPEAIASAANGFAALGREPGISGDGTVIGFTGERTAAPGIPGIHLSVLGTSGRAEFAVAGNGSGDLVAFADQRIGVVSSGRPSDPAGQEIKVVFGATHRSGTAGVYLVEAIASEPPTGLRVDVQNVTALAEVGVTVLNGRLMSSFRLFDPISDGGWIAFHAGLAGGVSAVVRAKPGGSSSVLFIPGFMGSEIQEGASTIWPSLISFCSLKPDELGNAPGSSAGGMLLDLLGLLDVYGSFATFLDQVVADGVIAEWRALPYDWRMSQTEIAEGPDVQATLEALAASSQTGKVTLIGHSNGGIVIKALLQALADRGKLGLVDRALLVGVPQLGTPEAVGSLLHGVELPIDVLSTFTREVAEHMIGAAGLLPSQGYFSGPTPPAVIRFKKEPRRSLELVDLRAQHGDAIRSYGDDEHGLRGFLLGEAGRRTETWDGPCLLAPLSGITKPNVLRPLFLDRAQDVHVRVDAAPPAGVDIIQVVGDRIPTTSQIEYESRPRCVLFDCGWYMDNSRKPTARGDGSVVVPSAAAEASAETFFVDLEGSDRIHYDITGLPELQQFILAVLEEKSDPTNVRVSRTPGGFARWVQVLLRSPASLHAYDSAGRHTGPAAFASPPVDFGYAERGIPGSTYSEGGGHAYLTLDMRERRQIEIVGESIGTVSIEVEEYLGDQIVGKLSYPYLPVASGTVARFDLQELVDAAPLRVDINGDGSPDRELTPSVDPALPSYLPLLAEIVRGLKLERGVENSLLAKLEAGTAAFERGNRTAGTNILEAFLREVKSRSGKGLPEESARQLLETAGLWTFLLKEESR